MAARALAAASSSPVSVGRYPLAAMCRGVRPACKACTVRHMLAWSAAGEMRGGICICRPRAYGAAEQGRPGTYRLGYTC